MAVEGRRLLLKARSQTAHSAVEAAIGAWRSAADYRRYLVGMLAFRLPLEARLARVGWPPGLASWRPLAIAAELRQDLRDLDIAVQEPQPPKAGAAPCPAEAIGIAYVLEGSNLGATVLSRRARDIGLGDEHGARHLARQRAGLGNWRRFLSLVEALEPLDMDRAGDAALAAFDAASAAFAKA